MRWPWQKKRVDLEALDARVRELEKRQQLTATVLMGLNQQIAELKKRLAALTTQESQRP